ncbi:MAG TPA: hypothetical protein VNI61_02475 [Gemmatimonadales bacterium]|nr:hypothetical protein [Gemmatimonadales bacterium]
MVRDLKRGAAAAVVGMALWLAGAGATAAQRPGDTAQAGMEQQMQMMGPMMGMMMHSMMEGMLAVLAKPETAERLATFTKNYYDALVRKGFTKEEALRIVTAVGIPTPAMGR